MNKQPSVLLAYPSSFNCSEGIDDVDLKTSLLVLGTYLGRYYPVEYLDLEIAIGRPDSKMQLRRFERRVRAYFEEHACDVLGLSCWTSMSYRATLVVAGIFRELYPDKLIVVGGYHPSARPDEFKQPGQLFDYVVCGEGEQAFREIIDQYVISGRPSQMTLVNGATTTADKLQACNWDLVDSFTQEFFPEGLRKLYIYLSRGCPFDCSFCMESLKDRRWRAVPPEQAIEQLQEAVERFRPRIVGIADACFGLRTAWRKEFLKLLSGSRPDYQIIFETRPEYMDEDDIEVLAGLDVEVQFGIESGSGQMLRLMRKTKQPDKYLGRFRRLSKALSDHRILHRANIIFNHPGETEQTLKETFAFIDPLLEVPDSYLLWVCRPYMHYPGCELDRNQRYYEETFGSRFYSPEWWRKDCNQYMASLDSVPSTDLSGERRELWSDMLVAREKRFLDGLAERPFRYAAEKYFPAWLDEARYVQIKV